MQNTKKTVLKIVLMTALLCPAVYADGDMGSGGKTCPEGQQTCLTSDTGGGGVTSSDAPTKNERTADGDMGSGGLSGPIETQNYLESVLRSIYAYFDWSM